MGRWETLPLPAVPGGRKPYLKTIVTPEGGVWIAVHGSLYYWDGQRFQRPKRDDSENAQGAYWLYGGRHRDAYAAKGFDHVDSRIRTWSIYRLSQQEVRHAADLKCKATGYGPGLYSSKAGRLYHYSPERLAVYVGGRWKSVPAQLLAEETKIFEGPEAVHFFCGCTIYSAGAQHRFTVHDLPFLQNLPRHNWKWGVVLTPWEQGKLIVINRMDRRVHVVNLKTFQSEPAGELARIMGGKQVADIFFADDGALWVSGKDMGEPGYAFYRLVPTGQAPHLTPVARLEWMTGRSRDVPHSVLMASDGSIWLAGLHGKVVRYGAGKVRTFGWPDGLNVGRTNALFEGQAGKIFAASSRAIACFHPSQPRAPVPQSAVLWDEFAPAGLRPIGDSNGNIWMCFKDRFGECSRWDGAKWHHLKAPFDTRKSCLALADDRGQVLMQVLERPYKFVAVGPNGTECFESWQDMLEDAALMRGAKLFFGGRKFQGCCVTEYGEIVFRRRYSDPHGVLFFNGVAWETLSLGTNSVAIHKSFEHDFLVRTWNGQYHAFDGANFHQVSTIYRGPTRWMLGPQGVQPYEEGLIEWRPKLFLPLELVGDGRQIRKRYLMATPKPRNGNPASGPSVRGDVLPHFLNRLCPGYREGYWVFAPEGIFRVVGTRVIECDFDDSPLAHLKAERFENVVEDKSHNLWIDCGCVFRKQLDGFRLKLGPVPRETKDSLAIAAEPILPGLTQERLRLFWRFKGGIWRGGDLGGSATVHLPMAGTYHIELMGMDPIGGTTPEIYTFTVTTVPPP